MYAIAKQTYHSWHEGIVLTTICYIPYKFDNLWFSVPCHINGKALKINFKVLTCNTYFENKSGFKKSSIITIVSIFSRCLYEKIENYSLNWHPWRKWYSFFPLKPMSIHKVTFHYKCNFIWLYHLDLLVKSDDSLGHHFIYE